MPITDEPSTPDAPPDSKYGMTNLNALKKTVDQTGIADTHSQATSNYANADDPPKDGGLHSLPSVTVSTSGNANQSGSSPHAYKRQASIPNDTSLSGGSERMAGISTGTATNSAVSDNNAILPAAVPVIDQPTPERSQAPPDSKYGRTNLNYLKNKLQHKKEVTQIAAQAVSPGNYANAEIPYQGVSDSTTKPVTGKADLTNLRNKLEKMKEEREKTLTSGNVNKKAYEDYCNIGEFAQYTPENPVMVNKPPNKRPMAVPRRVNPSNHANNDSRSALSTPSSKRTYQLWQCAHCETVNEARHTACEHCKLPPGRKADRSYFCNFCQMMIFVPVRRVDLKDAYCPRCKHVYDSIL